MGVKNGKMSSNLKKWWFLGAFLWKQFQTVPEKRIYYLWIPEGSSHIKCYLLSSHTNVSLHSLKETRNICGKKHFRQTFHFISPFWFPVVRNNSITLTDRNSINQTCFGKIWQFWLKGEKLHIGLCSKWKYVLNVFVF